MSIRECSFIICTDKKHNNITTTMVAHHKNGPLAFHNRRSDDTTSGTSGSTESEMHGSYYNWRGNDPLLPEVNMTALCSMRRSEDLTQMSLSSALEISRRRLLNGKSQNMARFLHTDREVRIFYGRVKILCRHRI